VPEFVPIWEIINRAYRMRQASIICKNNNADDKDEEKNADIFHKKRARLKPDPRSYSANLAAKVSTTFFLV